MAGENTTEWSSGVLDCWKDKFSCCYAFWCWPCFAINISKKLGQPPWLPLCDLCTPAALSLTGIPLFFPPVALSLRIAMRQKYGIKGSLFNDILRTCFCDLCVWCQMGRELKHREESEIPVTSQPVSKQGK